MRKMENLEYSYFINELRILENSFFKKAFEPSPGIIQLRFRAGELLIHLGTAMYFSKHIASEKEPTSFIMKLRKELENRKLLSVFQHKKDRIIIFSFGEKELIVEMFGNGNLILTENGKILAVRYPREWKGRSLKYREEYRFPPSEQFEITELKQHLSEKPVGAILKNLDIGMKYVKILLKIAEIAHSKKGNLLTDEELNKIQLAYNTLMDSQKPILAEDDYSLYGEGKHYSSFSELLERFYQHNLEHKEEKKENQDEKILRHQFDRLSQLEEEEKQAKQKADYIYSKYIEVSEILDAYKNGKLDSVKEKYKIKWKNKEKKEIEIEL
ncbi:NFACT family protein [Candidatus Micrarchaeota archaeon]|nr:NFACT family protein [Candidatus Micrarchaeota archaeon]